MRFTALAVIAVVVLAPLVGGGGPVGAAIARERGDGADLGELHQGRDLDDGRVFDSIPITLEEAAWVEGCSVFGSFTRIVLRNSLPGILSTAIFSFLLAWNDYLVAVVFLQTNWGPVMAVAVCGISGSLAGR